jgi:hypothetical protein
LLGRDSAAAGLDDGITFELLDLNRSSGGLALDRTLNLAQLQTTA